MKSTIVHFGVAIFAKGGRRRAGVQCEVSTEGGKTARPRKYIKYNQIPQIPRLRRGSFLVTFRENRGVTKETPWKCASQK